MKQILLATGFLIVSFTVSYGQSETGKSGGNVTIVLFDNSEIKGEIVSDDDKEIVIRSASLGLLTFQKNEVEEIIYQNKKGYFPNPMPVRYLHGHSAFNLRKDKWYVSTISFLFQSLRYGITDNLSAEAGISLYGLTLGQFFYYGNLKYGLPIAKNLRVAASLFTSSPIDILSSSPSRLSSLSGLITYGNTENNITVGNTYFLRAVRTSGLNFITVRAMLRISNRFSFLTENWILPSDALISPSAGLRLMWRKGTVNLLIPLLEEEFLPYMDPTAFFLYYLNITINL